MGMTGDDGSNAQIAAVAGQTQRQVPRPLTATVHLLDPFLCRLLRQQELRHANSNLPEGKVRVTVGNATREFDYRDIDTIWQIPLKMREVFSFMKANRLQIESQEDVNEYLNYLTRASARLKTLAAK